MDFEILDGFRKGVELFLLGKARGGGRGQLALERLDPVADGVPVRLVFKFQLAPPGGPGQFPQTLGDLLTFGGWNRQKKGALGHGRRQFEGVAAIQGANHADRRLPGRKALRPPGRRRRRLIGLRGVLAHVEGGHAAPDLPLPGVGKLQLRSGRGVFSRRHDGSRGGQPIALLDGLALKHRHGLGQIPWLRPALS